MTNKVVSAASVSLVVSIVMSLIAVILIDAASAGKLAFLFFISALTASLWVSRERGSVSTVRSTDREYDDKATTASSPSIPERGSPSPVSSDRQQGAVKWFNANKGYGFIMQENGDELFVHYRSIRGTGHRTLNEGDAVEFIITQGRKGPQADDLVILG